MPTIHDLDHMERQAHAAVLDAARAVRSFDAVQSPALAALREVLLVGAQYGIHAYERAMRGYGCPPTVIRGMAGNGPITSLVKRDDTLDYTGVFSTLAAECLGYMYAEAFSQRLAVLASDLRDAQRRIPGTSVKQVPGTLRAVLVTSVLRACQYLARAYDDNAIANMRAALDLQAALANEKLAHMQARHAWQYDIIGSEPCVASFLARARRLIAEANLVAQLTPQARPHANHSRGYHGKRHKR